MSQYIYIGQGGSNYAIVTYWALVSATSGTITIKAGGTLKEAAFQDLENSVVSETSGGLPTFNAAVTAGGSRITSTLDSAGVYSLSDTPSSFPVALVYRVFIPESDIDWNSDNIILEDIERPGGSGSGTISGGANTGSGEGVFKDVSGSNLRFKSLTGNGINITSSATEINLAVNSYSPSGW